jgi:G3E family GTPase
MNEFSDTADIEARAISVQSSSGAMSTPLLTLPNGCLCCAARDDGFAAIQELVAQRGAFDYILLETTGLADPGPIAESFWQNEEWDADVRLDGVVCLADAMWATKVRGSPASSVVDDSLMCYSLPDPQFLPACSKPRRLRKSAANPRNGRSESVEDNFPRDVATR